MIVFPAIDLKAGQVVRLAEGDMDRATVYADDPAAQAALIAMPSNNSVTVFVFINCYFFCGSLASFNSF